MRRAAILLGFAMLMSCNDHPVDEPLCGDGENVRLPTERELCVYRWPIVIETGFECPVERASFFGREPHFGTCSSFGPPLGIELDFLVDRYAVPGRPWPLYSEAPAAPVSESLDLLWVIDNSGSMCQEQAALRANFRSMIEGISENTADFQIAVTTTDMNPDYALETVAQPGHLQATPQPVPGFDRSCHTALDGSGAPIPGDFSPIREALEVAVGCMTTPDESLLAVTDAEIECAMYGGADCPGATPETLFPDPGEYRQIPTILRSSDYETSDGLDVERLTADFACMSLVGTRGYGIEKGLAAAVSAVSPQNLAGPNAGLIRPDARLAVMFVSDENDCTHDGSLPEDSACGGDFCDFYNREEFLGGPLIPVVELRAQLLGHLETAKGRAVADEEVFVGAVAGSASRFSGEVSETVCADAGYEGVPPTCQTTFGKVYSGDRYNRFAAQFKNSFPAPDDAGQVNGLLCQGEFTPALNKLGAWLGAAGSVVE